MTILRRVITRLDPRRAAALTKPARALVAAATGMLGVFVPALPFTPAEAFTGSLTFDVSATIQATCLVGTSVLSFGTYTGKQMDVTATVTVTCTETTPYNIGLDSGAAPGATVTSRQMIGPNAVALRYALYRDATRTINWGDTVGIDTLSAMGNGSGQPITIYGRAPAGQFVAPGAYVDLIVATVTY
jgi:spore coat protein U-like protein